MTQEAFEKVAAIVRDAGGKITGRTKLQKIAYILEEAGLGSGFEFSYYHYGPFSEKLAATTKDAVLAGLVSENEQFASWGGAYSVYEVKPSAGEEASEARIEIAQASSRANSVELELAATALYLAKNGCPDPWEETARRKPEKADGGRLGRARILYDALTKIKTPNPLPQIS